MAREGGTVGAMGGDGFVRPLAGALRDSSGAAGGAARRPRQRLRPGAGHPPRARRGRAQVAVSGRERMVDVGFVGDEPFLGVASYGIDSNCQHYANTTKLVRGSLVYLYRRPAGAEGVAAARASASWPTASAAPTRATPPRWPTPGVFGGGMELLPMAEVDDGQLDVLLTKGHPKWRYLRGLTQVFSGKHLDPRFTEVLRAAEVEIDSAPPYDVFADGDPIGRTPTTGDRRAALPARAGAGVRLAFGRFLARMARALSRVVGRTGGTTVPGRLLLRADPEALAEPLGAAGRGLGAGLGHQRQDDHLGDAVGLPGPGGALGGAQPRRLEHGLGRGHRAAGRRRGAGASSACSRSTRRGCRAWPSRSTPS